MRVQLRPGLARAWRAPDTVQIGLDPQRGAVVTGLTPAEAALLDRIAVGVDDSLLVDGLPAEQRARGRQLLGLLDTAGVLLPSRSGRAALTRLGDARGRLSPDCAVWCLAHPDCGDGWELLAARGAHLVEVRGAGRTGASVAVALASAGVRVHVVDPRPVTEGDVLAGAATEADVGAPRQDAAAAATARAAGRPARGAAPDQRAGDRPRVVVLVEHRAADSTAAAALVRADIAHLSVVVRESTAVVGPFVRPGHGPCLRCLDLHRGDRDPAWPRLMAQLTGLREGADEPEEATLSTLAASLATLQVLAYVDGIVAPAALGATLEVELPQGLTSRRTWPAHPACGCHWPPPPSRLGAVGAWRGE